MCLRPVKGNKHANDDNYRTYQREAQTIIEAEKAEAISKLQEIQTNWINNPTEDHANTKIPEMVRKLQENIRIIKEEDSKPYPNFRQIKNEWNILTRQIQNIETTTETATNKGKIRQIQEQLDKNRQHRELTAQTIKDNKIKINTLMTKTNNTVEDVRNNTPALTKEEREDDEKEVNEEEQTREEGYFQRIYKKWQTQQQSLQSFCENWGFDCKAIVMGSLIMTMI